MLIALPIGDCRTLKHSGVVVGEIDIDSTQLSTFDDEDRVYLEKAADIIAPHLTKLANTQSNR